MMSMILGMIVLIGILVFVHELGHYLVAKLYGIGVEIFSIGFGPVIFSFKKGETVYQLAAIPLGGYVKLTGSTREEEVSEEFRGKEMYNKAPWKRLLVLAAGPVFNIIFAAFIFAMISLSGVQVFEPVIGHTIIGGPAQQAGLQPGDKILTFNDKPVDSWEEFGSYISMNPGKKVKLTLSRQGQPHTVEVTPEKYSLPGTDGKRHEFGKIGIYRGFLNSYLTILSQDSLAYKAGLRTGDRVVALEYLHNGQTKTLTSQFWSQLIEAQKQITSDRPEKITFVLQGSNKQTRRVESGIIDFSRSALSKGKIWKTLGISLNTLIVSTEGQTLSQLQTNDVILSWNGKRLVDLQDYYLETKDNKKPKATVLVNRDGKELELDLKLQAVEKQTMKGRETFYSIASDFPMRELSPLPTKIKVADNIFTATADGFKATYFMTIYMVKGIWDLITGALPAGAVGGPISIAKVAGDSIQMGLQKFFEVMAIISINLAIVNFIPIPVLDGGRMVIVTIEWIRRRPLSTAALENFYKVGFVMVMSLFILATYNDLSRFWGSMVKRMLGLFQ